MLKHYVEYYLHGIIKDKDVLSEIPERDVDKIDVPHNAYGFRFFDSSESITKVTEDSKLENISPNYYYGKEYTHEEAKKAFPDYEKAIVDSGLDDDWRVVLTINENVLVINKDDVVLTPRK